ncbi:MAG: hypothetical protein KJZ74_02445 [Gemmatimonadales bacterium]|nr:hypothetical protein [Gemmatimonadales bacterium]
MRARRDRALRAGGAALLVVTASAFAAACGGAVLVDPLEGLAGDWNGVGASLRLDAAGGEIEFDCAHGGLSATVRPDRSGAFETPGVFVREHGGPIRIDEVPDSIPARYIGRVRGDELTLRVMFGSDSVGPLTLLRDGPVRLFKCL